MGRAVVTASLLVATVLVATACQRTPEPRQDVTVRGATLSCYVADTQDEQVNGLQGFDITEDEGMLFTWTEPAVRAFEIREVGYPLDVVWVDADQRVAGVSAMAPDGPRFAESPVSVVWVIEARGGWAERNGVRAGDAVVLAEPR